MPGVPHPPSGLTFIDAQLESMTTSHLYSQSLHWLPVKYRVIFKILLLVYKGLNGLAPTYITDLLSYRKYTRALRSASQSFLKITRMNTKSYGDRAFSVSGPKLWNGLPLQIRESRNINSFKTALKTHLFREAYSL